MDSKSTSHNSIPGLSNPYKFVLIFLSIFIFGCQSADPVELNFAYSPDNAKSNEKAVEDFNRKNRGKIKVNLSPSSRISDQFYHQIVKDFTSDAPTFDIIGADVVWTASFASNGWVQDLSRSFYEDYNAKEFLNEALNSAIYSFHIWGIPWFTDAGVLFYRKDLLEKHGYTNPPKTYAELKSMCYKMMSEENMSNGYVFQGAMHEGGVANAVEYVWNSGGSVLIGDISITGSFEQEVIDPNVITINDPRSVKGFEAALDLITSNVSPKAVVTYREAECEEIFASGEAVFMRAWPAAYKAMLNSPTAKITADQIGVSVLPVSDASQRSYSCLGGWNLMIRAGLADAKLAAAQEFIKFMVSPEQQKMKAIEAGNLPTLHALYDDTELMNKLPIIGLSKEVMNHTRARPVSPYYMEISPKISQVFNQVLQGNLDPKKAVLTLEDELEVILVMNR